MKLRIKAELIIPFIIIGIVALFGFTRFFSMFDGLTYNAFLGSKEQIAERPELILVDVDDRAVEMAGSWPMRRSIFGRALLVMRELGARTAVFDIEYVDASQRGINADYLDTELPRIFNHEFESLQSNTRALIEALSQGYIPPEDAQEYLPDLRADAQNRKETLLKSIEGVVIDNDEYLGRAAAFFQDSFFTINMFNIPTPVLPEDEELAFLIETSIPLEGITVVDDSRIPRRNSMNPTIYPVLSRAAGAGFPNVIIDSDGIRRRINLIYKFQDRYYGQLAFRPLLDYLGNPEITIYKDKIVLSAVKDPRGSLGETVTIPLAPDGTMLINWLHTPYVESFTHLPFGELMLHDQLFTLLIRNLDARRDWGYLQAHQGQTPLGDFLNYWHSLILEMESAPDQLDAQGVYEIREQFLAEVASLLQPETRRALESSIEEVYAAGNLPEEDYQVLRQDIPQWFEATAEVLRDLNASRQRLTEYLDGAFAIIGHTATATTDIGVNPFHGEYMNVGTHASIANTILNNRFLDQTPDWVGLLIAALICIPYGIVASNLDSKKILILGIILLTILVVALLVFFILTGIYPDSARVILAFFLTFITTSIVKFFSTEREKSFLRKAFSHYLSTDVIKEIVSNPERLKLGGDKKVLTAIFTDVRGFSTISEKLDPVDLVKLLNRYLGAMSDIILDMNGTIDKYEGDAIISFFGAPIDIPDHADRACLSAVRMKRLEQQLNQEFQAQGMSPDHLLTRIGINTGEMVVGNMGTEKKMDYTIMGNHVNLAARLEGVNKLYGTWILTSEATKTACTSDLVFRKLDRVRVVGIKEPVRLYEVVEERDHLDGQLSEILPAYHRAFDLFEAKDWEAARKGFAQILSKAPEDGPSKLYLERCEKFISSPPKADWDGVFNMTTK
ncbi:CHASE2 domain-containing protein [Spirochaeta lutea]|uniref:Guanylate cyclase domain-containing protein n=1 Tax=Spirochaeta lutea TaxID=1480694 RepID=A0A098QTP1_9SPIO|nr:CHASE2 domain-containing protein [Spirochaeta lutea]KGE70931.1 hypothetical protein DC28_13390 [Spirochaeta lutea]